MTIHGREVHFLLTTGAMKEIAETCPDGDLQKLSEAMAHTAGMFETVAKMAASMSKWYELSKAFEVGNYKGRALTYEECLVLSPDDFNEMTKEVLEAFVGGRKTEIETEPIKKNEITE